MKKTVLLLFLIVSAPAMARGLETGTCSAELSLSAVDGFKVTDNFSAELRFAKLVRQKTEIAVSLTGLKTVMTEDIYRIPVIQGTASFVFSHILISARRSTLALWADIEAAAGYEYVNNGSRTLPDGATLLNSSCFLWGGMVSLRLEIPLSRRTAVSLRVRERAMPSSTTAIFHTEASLGFRIRL